MMLFVLMIPDADGTLYVYCYWASDLWQQLQLASKLESDLRDTGVGEAIVLLI